jgi:hypothetical protein
MGVIPLPPANHAHALGAPNLEPAALALELLDREHPSASVLVPPLGPLEVQRVANLQRVHVLAHLAALREPLVGEVHLDDEVDDAQVVIGRGGGVRPTLLLAVRVHVRQRDVLAHGQAEAVLLRGEREAEQVGVVAQLSALDERQGHLRVRIHQRLLRLQRLGEHVQQDDEADAHRRDGQHEGLDVHAVPVEERREHRLRGHRRFDRRRARAD